ncbi:hypothetical protein CRG98_027195 [Punica granatum]|uniref:Uncharacterized protein n=1 Tax=Punica granatum TaxID=22663 RepID=A0A2I0J824_PUNGR|nr:hypothetical protein CRG98_027195 [Punica granatum]
MMSHEAKRSPKRMLRCTKSNRGPGALNSTPNAQTGQNRLSRRRVARTFVHTMHGDIRLIQILFVQAFQIYKLIGHRRPDARSIKSQAFSGFSLDQMGPTAQPSQAVKPRLNPKPRLSPSSSAWPQLAAAQTHGRWLQGISPSLHHTIQIPLTSITSHHPSITPITHPLPLPTLNMT